MILSTCTPYFRDLIAQSDKKDKKILFTTACRILAPELQNMDADTFCKELGVSKDFASLYNQSVAEAPKRKYNH
jgi:hypothetical protein